ncbi:GntR family transcriptional regulator [Desulfobaculum bizertense]|uniref:Transcriptional regulator, GntR family n=1 Tax=Desulfobaculum bizertense DSM 18034 TaxID=1121442 RepID=A0A1T4VPU6_9BACT|nr:GntR family transcriptional regulator [Desulfobaculum bizertense]UIJ38240.1 GntR family transcriptional regulator [Desulfobaculum bizertense]SKA66947.1 transcriptional regulator, GntR family [Desulfobaculum bizertense DSM 18034]
MKKNCFYTIVLEHILSLISTGELMPGDKLPSERALCSALDQNRNTVRHALLLLQREGKIFRLERKGWYLTPTRLVYNPANHINFARLAESQGRKAHWTTIDNGIVHASNLTDTGGDEGFPSGTPVYEMDNVFSLDGLKVACVKNYIHAERLPGIIPKTAHTGMTQVAEEQYSTPLIQRRLLIRPLLLPKFVTTELSITPGSPGVYVRRIKTDSNSVVLTVEHEYWRFDAIELRVDQ